MSGQTGHEACALGQAWWRSTHTCEGTSPRPLPRGHQGRQFRPGAGGYGPRSWPSLALPPCAPGRSRASIRIGSGYAPFPAQAGPCRKEEGAGGGGRGMTLPNACPVAPAARGWAGQGLRGPGEPMEPLPAARGFHASWLCPLAAAEPPVQAGREGGHRLGGQGLSSPPSVPSNLEELGPIPGWNWSAPFLPGLRGDRLPPLLPALCHPAHLGPRQPLGAGFKNKR